MWLMPTLCQVAKLSRKHGFEWRGENLSKPARCRSLARAEPLEAASRFSVRPDGFVRSQFAGRVR